MIKLSLVMIVRNEEKKLERCLKSVQALVDEIVIVDTGSEDSTLEIAKAYNVKLFQYPWNNHFSEARNFALSKSTGDWNLILDADEWVTKGNRQQLNTIMDNQQAIGRIRITSSFFDGEESYTHCYTSRLIPRGIFYKGRIHEQIDSALPRVDCELEVAHDGYYKTDKSERNLALLLSEIQDYPDDPYLHYQTAKEYYGISDYENANKHYVLSYTYLSGYENYYPNVVVDYLYNIMKYGNMQKGLEIIQSEETRMRDFPDFYFVCGLFYMNLVSSDVSKYLHLLLQIQSNYIKALEIGETSKYLTVEGTGSYAAAYNLGVFYETTGDTQEAIRYYKEAEKYNYRPALNRLAALNH
ncbi:glycosyltransferase [Paenibacillus sp. J2TS4]|uniref:glycosyltransferase n=1 Tax=Paenibacillus sp. J2TS4 TaxID=2807194 RepID=UPI001B23FFA2|nr:glycosyltransferase [Paenibacillus sp. J2TS4]GIP35603.1 hypothetical protein J2TS4_48130 [Paenibacillus sp. J2TS4]